jgi:hypothetical protein
VDDGDFKKPVRRASVTEQPLSEVGEVGDVVDHRLRDPSTRVADDGSVSDVESKEDRGVDSMVETRDNDHLRSGRAEWYRDVITGVLLVALE